MMAGVVVTIAGVEEVEAGAVAAVTEEAGTVVALTVEAGTVVALTVEAEAVVAMIGTDFFFPEYGGLGVVAFRRTEGSNDLVTDTGAVSVARDPVGTRSSLASVAPSSDSDDDDDEDDEDDDDDDDSVLFFTGGVVMTSWFPRLMITGRPSFSESFSSTGGYAYCPGWQKSLFSDKVDLLSNMMP
jgi:hypothetical protein